MNAAAGSSSEGSSHVENGKDTAIGARLRAARNQRGLQIETVAEQLHLDTAIIRAIESEDKTTLPAPIFVQGYVRSYARLVGLPEEELVQQYIAQCNEPPPLAAIGTDSRVPLVRLPSARLVRNAILILLGGILLWLAYPLLERFIENRSGIVEEQLPGRLELPPAYEDETPPVSSRPAE